MGLVLRGGASRNLGALGRTDAVPVEVGPKTDESDHTEAGERGSYLGN